MGDREGTEEGRTDGEEVVVFSKRFPRKTGNRRIKAIFVRTMSALNLTIVDLKFWESDLKLPLTENGHGMQTQWEALLYPSRRSYPGF